MKRPIFCLDIDNSHIIGVLANVDYEGNIDVFDNIKIDIKKKNDEEEYFQAIEKIKKQIEKNIGQTIKNVILSTSSSSTYPKIINLKKTYDKPTLIEKSQIKILIDEVTKSRKDHTEIPTCFLPLYFEVDHKPTKEIINKKAISLDLKMLVISSKMNYIFPILNAIQKAKLTTRDIVLDIVSENFGVSSSNSFESTLILSMNDEIKVIETFKGVSKRTMWSEVFLQEIIDKISKKYKIDNFQAEKMIFRIANLSGEAKDESYFITLKNNKKIELDAKIINEDLKEIFSNEFIRLKNEITRFFSNIKIIYMTGKWAKISGIDVLFEKIIGKQVLVFSPTEIGIDHSIYTRVKGTLIYSLISENYRNDLNEIIAYEVKQEKSNINDIDKNSKSKKTVKKDTKKSIFSKLTDAIMYDD